MQPNRSSQKTVLKQLKTYRSLDSRYSDGHILCSMCTKPHPIAKKAYQLFFESNLGDQALFPGAAQLEREVIAQLSSLLHGGQATGFLVSGGTEANLLALQAAKNQANNDHPEVILPESAHFSFTKICKQLNLKTVTAPLDNAYKANTHAVKQLINKNTVAIVGTAGTAELGAVDPIAELSTIAHQHNIHLHVDAAFGGLILPFQKNPEPFDFQLEGVKTITVDPHKMGMAAIPAGGALFREPEMIECLKTETPYLNENYQYTFVGTRTGASAASAWAVFNLLGRAGFRKIVNACMDNTRFVSESLQRSGYNLVCEPTLPVIGFRSQNTKKTEKQLREKGWFTSYIPRYDCIRIVLMPHVKHKHASAFLEALAQTEKL